jgi:hypothetical protein
MGLKRKQVKNQVRTSATREDRGLMPFLKVYMAFTAPECTDSQPLLREETQTKSLCYNFNQKWYYFPQF